MSPRSTPPKRRTSAKAKRRASGNVPVKLVKGNTAQISKNRIAELGGDPDFSAAIKTGRALNALAFASDVLDQWTGKKLPHERRNEIRSMFIMASYVYESLLVLKHLDETYSNDASFGAAATLLADKSKWAVCEKMRNRAGFHLDSKDQVTTTTLGSMPNKNFDLYSAVDIGPEMTLQNYYFGYADQIDLTYFVEEFKGPGRTTGRQVTEFIERDLIDITVKLIKALRTFHFSLLSRLHL